MKHLFALLALVALLPAFGNIVDDIKKAAESGDPFSQMQLAELYSVGRGVPMDANESMRWVRKAAEQGYPDGQYVLSRACRAGQGVAKGDKEAMRWLIKAAESGHMHAQYDLAMAHSKGEGTPKNQEEALKWFRKSAKTGHSESQMMLGQLMFNDQLEPRYEKEAADLFWNSAVQGNTTSQYYLGALFSLGKFVEKDDVLAYALLAFSAANGNKEATRMVGRAASIVSAEGLVQGKELAANPREMFRRILVEKIGPRPDQAPAEPLTPVEDYDDAFVGKTLLRAIDHDTLKPGMDFRSGGFVMMGPDQKPYSGWVKSKFPDGKLLAVYQLIDGKMNGMGIEWHPNGKRKRQGRWSHGLPPAETGLWIYYKEDGTEESRKTFSPEDTEKQRKKLTQEAARANYEKALQDIRDGKGGSPELREAFEGIDKALEENRRLLEELKKE